MDLDKMTIAELRELSDAIAKEFDNREDKLWDKVVAAVLDWKKEFGEIEDENGREIYFENTKPGLVRTDRR